jgi:3-methyladenine DNA glycosylase AlkD
MTIVDLLRAGLLERADADAAAAMRAYMKSPMPFHGVAKPARAQLLRAAVAAHPVTDAGALATAADALWDGATHREERYLAVALVDRYQRMVDAGWLPRLRRWIVEGAWWDFTDDIASRRVGPLLRADPATVRPVVLAWVTDEDRWLRRTSVICQLGARAAVDVELLTTAIEANVDDPDFFLRKGIGWALRQHARVDPDWVRRFVADHPGLSPLSRREALRVIGTH